MNAVNDRHIQDVKVIRSELHPNYDSRDRTNDIAILYLDRDVNFTGKQHKVFQRNSFDAHNFLSIRKDRIRPICLPLNESIRNRDFVNYTPFIAAWLRTQNPYRTSNQSPNVMRDWQLIVLSNADCKEQFKRQKKLISEKQFDESVMCAAPINVGQMKCQSDSGLMQPIYNHKLRTFSYYLTGILSYGISCQEGNTPAVYSRVAHFIDWIQEKVGQ